MNITGPKSLPSYSLWINFFTCNCRVKSYRPLTSQQQWRGPSLNQEALSPTILMAKLQAKIVRIAVAAAPAHVTQAASKSPPPFLSHAWDSEHKTIFFAFFVFKEKVFAAFWRGRKADSGCRPYTRLGNTAGSRIKCFFTPPPPKQWGKELEHWQLTAFPSLGKGRLKKSASDNLEPEKLSMGN